MKVGSVKKHVVIALPSYAGTVQIGTMRSLMHDMVALLKRGDLVSVSDESCNTELAVARALTVSRFLKGPGTHLVMVDHDVMWQAGGLLKLVDHGEDCVAGIYPMRKDPIAFPLRWLDDSKPNSFDTHGTKPLISVGGVGAGFLCCSRSMLQRMTEEYNNLAFERDGETTWDLFDRVMIGKRRLGEDYSFCERWRRMGGKVWVDPDIHMGHVGMKVFSGTFGQWGDGNGS